jgi:hypothetical protein
MVRRSTWILLAILALALGAYFVIKGSASKASNLKPTPAENTYLITQADGSLQSLRIFDTKGNNFRMQRDLSKIWVITAPSSGTADQGLAGGAETQVGALRIVVKLETPPNSGTIGLAVPVYTMELGFVSGASHKIEVGNMSPTSSGYYVRYDNGKTFIIAQSGIDALLNLLKAPPFPATATPEPTEGSTGTPSLEVASPTP